MLLTLSNLKALQADIVPHLIGQFEMNFSVQLTDESKTIRDDLAQIDAKLFKSYTQPTIDHISSLVKSGVSNPAWLTNSRPQQVRPYVHNALLQLVHVHTEVSTTASPLTTAILNHLFEKLVISFLEVFQTQESYSLPALMQAVLDVEFVAQAMSQYTTKRAMHTQHQIHEALDNCDLENDARSKSREEVDEIAAVMKRLREGTRSEFACFKQQLPQQWK